jgi:WD40 repeat protein
VWNISYSPQGDHLVSCGEDTTVHLWDVESGTCLHNFTGHTGSVIDVTFSPQGDQIASSSVDNDVRLWNVNTSECQHVLSGHSNGAWVVIYSPQGNQVASADGGTVRLWDVQTGACEHILTGHSDRVQRIIYSAKGNQIASVCSDTTVRLWDVRTGVCSHIFIGHQRDVTRVEYSPRGDQVASASYNDKTVRLWDIESGECRHTLTGHKMEIYAIAYSPSGKHIASWSDTGEGKLWDVETGDCYWNLNHGGPTQSANNYLSHPFVWMSPDVDTFITGYGDGSLKAWKVTGEGDQHRVHMHWRSINGRLTVEDACVQDVQGLNDFNKRLLKQRGATGEPRLRLREASKKVMSMVSVVSKFRSSSSGMDASSPSSTSPGIAFTGHPEQQTEQATGAEAVEN